MLRVLAPRASNNPRNHVDTQEPPSRVTTSQAESRRSSRSIPLLDAVAPTEVTRASYVRYVANHSSEFPTYQSWEIPHITKTPWEAERHRKHVSWRRTKVEYQFPAHFFRELPREVYDCIIGQLEQIHLRQDQSCPSCYLRDLSSLALVSRAWDKAATLPMYQNIILLANEHTRLPKLKTKGMSRLKLLRRTLRERSVLARYVRELNLADFQSLYENATIEREEIVNQVASLVMACPLLERLIGFHVPYTHRFDRLSHALSTRRNLRERTWFINETDSDSSDDEENEFDQYYLASCDPTERFLELHAKHPLLSTLVLHQERNRVSIPVNFRFIIGALQKLPALRHLALSGLPSASFTNLALNALPDGLLSLRLQNLPGINDKGLQRFVHSNLAGSIIKLTLIDLPITSLVTISCILSERLQSLRSFSIAQQKPPGLASHATVSGFSSPSVKYIHWEFRSEAGPLPVFPPPNSASGESEAPSFPFVNQEPICCLATSVLATSIENNSFPSLTRIRIPHDPQGVIQALSRPLATALLPSDAASIIAVRIASNAMLEAKCRDSMFGASSSPRADSAVVSSPSSSTTSLSTILTPSRSRLAAQSRLLAARKVPLMNVRVYDPKGNLQLEKAIRGFIGRVGSHVAYDLKPDVGRLVRSASDDASDRNEWITGIDDLVRRELEILESVGPVCGHPDENRVFRDIVKAEDLF